MYIFFSAVSAGFRSSSLFEEFSGSVVRSFFIEDFTTRHNFTRRGGKTKTKATNVRSHTVTQCHMKCHSTVQDVQEIYVALYERCIECFEHFQIINVDKPKMSLKLEPIILSARQRNFWILPLIAGTSTRRVHLHRYQTRLEALFGVPIIFLTLDSLHAKTSEGWLRHLHASNRKGATFIDPTHSRTRKTHLHENIGMHSLFTKRCHRIQTNYTANHGLRV